MVRRVKHELIADAAPIYEDEKIARYKCPHCGSESVHSVHTPNKGRCNSCEDKRQVVWEKMDNQFLNMKITGSGLELNQHDDYLCRAGELIDE